MLEWIRDRPDLMLAAAGVSLLMFVAGLVLVPLAIARIPCDYFLRPPRLRLAHPVLRLTLLGLTGLLGLALVLVGTAMLVLPGQGLLTILVGLSLLTFPGKRGLVLHLVRIGFVCRSLNWIRARAHRPPLVLEDPPAPCAESPKERRARSGGAP